MSPVFPGGGDSAEERIAKAVNAIVILGFVGAIIAALLIWKVVAAWL